MVGAFLTVVHTPTFAQLSELEGGNDKADSAPKESKPEASYEIAANKEKAVLAPEETFFEGPPSWTEMVIPGISILTVIGIVPFIATLTRQAWVKYKITSRRISVTSGFNGQVTTHSNDSEKLGGVQLLEPFDWVRSYPLSSTSFVLNSA